jgi:hypothetical protein
MLHCAQMHRDHYPVRSGSSTRTYLVTLFRPDELPACTCISFATRRNKEANRLGGGLPGAGAGLAYKAKVSCKHIDEVRATTCTWQAQGEDAPGSCPRCGGPVVEETAPRLPAGRGPVTPETPASQPEVPATERAQERPRPAASSEGADAAASELAKLLDDA